MPQNITAFGGTLGPKTLPILLNPFQIWQQMGPLGPFVAKFGTWRPHTYGIHCAPAGYLVAVSGPLCFGSAHSAHVVLFWAYFVAFGVYFELF